jgi:O-acetyl-ADP-ribose deacetylase (regulator of RNase III)
VGVYDLHALPDGGLILVMEYIEGTDLARLMKSRTEPLPEDEVVPWMRQVAEGMLAAAERRIIHRDLKPSNILIDRKGRARVADFGLSRGPTNPEDLTRSDVVVGTPYYMAPEQAEDPQGVDTRADVYSFGATFYHALTGTPPFEGKTPFAILYKHKTEPLISPRSRNLRISEWVSDLLERCLAKSTGDRFPSFADLLARLQVPSEAASPWAMSEDPSLTNYLATYRERRASYLSGPPQSGELDLYEFPRGRVLRILRGNIAEQRVDVVVSPYVWFSPRDGATATIHQTAGDAIAQEARRFAPVRPGRVIVTSAGRLSARFVFHGVTMGLLGDDWMEPSRDLINEIMSSCFYHADSLIVQSIAFPLLGSGARGLSRAVCLDTIFSFLARTFVHGLTCINDARIVIDLQEGT